MRFKILFMSIVCYYSTFSGDLLILFTFYHLPCDGVCAFQIKGYSLTYLFTYLLNYFTALTSETLL